MNLDMKKIRTEQSLEVIERIDNNRALLSHMEKRMADGIKRKQLTRVYKRKTEYMRRLEHLFLWIQTDDWFPAQELRTSFRAENDKILLEPFHERIKEDYLASLDLSDYNVGKDENEEIADESLLESYWQSTQQAGSFYCSITEKSTGAYLGYFAINNMSEKLWRIVTDISDMASQDEYDIQAGRLFIDRLAEMSGRTEFQYMILPEDINGRKYMEKIGADLRGIVPMCNPEESTFDSIVKQRKHLLNQDLVSLSEQICVDEKQILASFLDYRIIAQV